MKNTELSSTASRAQTLLVFMSLLCSGYLTGLFAAWSAAVMPGLATTDDHTFVAAIQGLETRFDGGDGGFPAANGNWPTFVAFFTGPIWCAAAWFAHRRQPAVSRLMAAAFGCLVAGTITSVAFNVPANLAITAAGDPMLASVDASQVRADFDEVSWTRWNHVRAVTSTLAFGLLALGFRRQGSTTSTNQQQITN